MKKWLLAYGWKILLVLIIGGLGIQTYKNVKAKIISFLSNPIELENVQIIPHSFQSSSPFKLRWESVKVIIDSTSFTFEKPSISIHPLLGFRRELLNISIDSIYVKIIPSDSSFIDSVEYEKNIKSLSHPDLNLPFRVSVNVNKATVNVKDIGEWSLDSFAAVKSARHKRFHIRASNIEGTHLANTLFLNADYRWNETFADASLLISDRQMDSLFITLNAPRLRLEDISAEISANIAKLPFWLKEQWPEEAPEIEKVTLHSNLSINLLTARLNFNLSLQTKIGELWPLPALNANITAVGNNSRISQSEISLKGNNGESINFKGNINRDLDGSGELEIKGIDIVLADETLPTDVKFHRITKKGNTITTNFSTGAGSNFNARIADINNPVITFDANIASEEPWAVQWTEGMVQLESPTLLNGSFCFKETKLRANLRTKVPFAYYASAEELNVSLWLDSEGIRFPKGTIKRRGYESNFTGEVMWDKEYFTFKLYQPGEGFAEIYGTLDPKIDLTLQNINTVELPFADTTMLKGYHGIVSGNWVHDVEKNIGNASVAVSTIFQDLNIEVRSDVDIYGDSLNIKNFEIEQNYRKISGFLFALLPSERRANFEIQETNINIPNMDLVSLLATFNDSTLASGYADGDLKYNKTDGFQSKIMFSQIAIRGLDSSIAKFPNIRFEAVRDTARIFSHLSISDGFWNGDIEANISRLGKKSALPVHVNYTVNNIDNVGKIEFDGFLSQGFKNVSGNTQVQGDWFLPNGIGEIKNTNLNISARTALSKNALDSLTASFTAKESIFEKGFLKIPFALNGRIRNGIVLVDSAFAYGQGNEKISAKLQFDLADASLKDLSFYTEHFTLAFFDEHWIRIKDGSGRTRLDSDGITIYAELPSINYRMESVEYGTAFATVQGQVAYRLPFQTRQSQTNPSITGNFEISKASYIKNFDVVSEFWSPDRIINMFFRPLQKGKAVGAAERHTVTGRPTTLNIRVQTSGVEAATVNSNILQFPFAVNLSILGTTKNVLLSGDINTVGSGKIGDNSIILFDLASFRIYWRDLPLKQGEIELLAYNTYPFCPSPRTSPDENCTISMDVTGTFSRLNMQPIANCNIDASPALIYYSMLLGCISSDFDGTFDAYRFLNIGASKLITTTAKRMLGDSRVGDIDFRWQFWSDTSLEQDTNYIRIPIKLYRNLEAVFGYTSDQSIDPRYDESIEAGLRYSLPIFDSTDINRNFIDPSLEINTNLVARSYHSKTESGTDETRLEKNVGLVYRHRFWDPCILGIGRCRGARGED
ncbi:MAG: hypothetical protein LBC85_09790 [Fibromonadaceae bacterium]|jgi:hypothetical protein|nr:hypothetical protein [Fibromonadaceae bacterium]